jgi:hypothetical protein
MPASAGPMNRARLKMTELIASAEASDRRLHFADADRYVSGTQHAVNCHGLSFLAAQRMPAFMGLLRSGWGPRDR